MKRTVRDPQGRRIPPAVTATAFEYLEVLELRRRGRRMTRDEHARAAGIAAEKYLKLNPEEAVYGREWPGSDEIERFAVACIAAAQYWPKQLGEREVWRDMRAKFYAPVPRTSGWTLGVLRQMLRHKLPAASQADLDDMVGVASVELTKAAKKRSSYRFTPKGLEFCSEVLTVLAKHAAGRHARQRVRHPEHRTASRPIDPSSHEPPLLPGGATRGQQARAAIDAVAAALDRRRVRELLDEIANAEEGAGSRAWGFVARHLPELSCGELSGVEVATLMGQTEGAIRKVQARVLAALEARLVG